ncbi:hypothetical protein ANN_26977 [Periplaneta americana]|uniref:Uncharacterized protein n=1 Tax=Periplaneta americana TaxID=6978 RepID=A0ABQ8RWW0_PERAM|nr:hypothetical protein ANN_26977 [Periplaneta americana]
MTKRNFGSIGYEALLEVTSDSSLQPRFKNLPVVDFWHSLRREYPVLSKKAITILLPIQSHNNKISYIDIILLYTANIRIGGDWNFMELHRRDSNSLR